MFEYNYKLVKVVDGDTIDVDIDLGFGVWLRNQRIRMMGIDTPESRTRDLEEKKFGLLAKDKLQTLLANGKVIKTFKDAKGKFGRILADVIVYHSAEDRWCGATEIMIAQGYGVKYEGQSKEEIQEAHLANRKKLTEQGLAD
jgi:micrococcal nuclease